MTKVFCTTTLFCLVILSSITCVHVNETPPSVAHERFLWIACRGLSSLLKSQDANFLSVTQTASFFPSMTYGYLNLSPLWPLLVLDTGLTPRTFQFQDDLFRDAKGNVMKFSKLPANSRKRMLKSEHSVFSEISQRFPHSAYWVTTHELTKLGIMPPDRTALVTTPDVPEAFFDELIEITKNEKWRAIAAFFPHDMAAQIVAQLLRLRNLGIFDHTRILLSDLGPEEKEVAKLPQAEIEGQALGSVKRFFLKPQDYVSVSRFATRLKEPLAGHDIFAKRIHAASTYYLQIQTSKEDSELREQRRKDLEAIASRGSADIIAISGDYEHTIPTWILTPQQKSQGQKEVRVTLQHLHHNLRKWMKLTVTDPEETPLDPYFQ